MDDELLNSLAGTIARGDCALFAGSALSIKDGGVTWNELVENTSERFRYSSPLTDNYEILHDIVQEEGREEVHKFIKSELEGISLSEPVSYLTGLPWYATFTTNYDTALEDALKQNQDTRVRTIIDSGKFELSHSNTHLLCVKLMGSITSSPYDKGSMVLTRGDRERAKDERSRMFDILGSYAAEKSFLFVGYSFSDGIFESLLEQVITKSGAPDGNFYALFKNEPAEEKRYRLESLGVEPIVGDIGEFAEELKDRVSARDTSDYRTKAVPFGEEVVSIPNEEIGRFLESYDPILNERYTREVSPNEFYRGNSDSFRPFVERWHFRREAENEVLRSIREENCSFINVFGQPGSGRSFIISAAVQRLIANDRAIAIDLPTHTWSSVPYSDEVEDFLSAIEQRADEVGVNGPEMVVLFSKQPIGEDDRAQFEALKKELSYRTVLISESIDKVDPQSINMQVANISLNKTVPSDRRKDFIDYLVYITDKHSLVGVDRDRAKSIISEDPEYMPVMWKSIFQTRKSIQEIVAEEYEDLEGELERELVNLCTIATFLDTRVPVTVCRRYLETVSSESIDWREIFNIQQSSQSLVTETTDSRESPLFGIYHSIVADHLCEWLDVDDVDEILMNLAESVDLKSEVESDFIGEILISQGVQGSSSKSPPFSNDGLEKSLERLAELQPARPILHHLALLKHERGRDEEEYIPLLEKALEEESERYESYEREEHILVTLGNLKWSSLKDEVGIDNLHIDNDRVQSIIDDLINSRQVEYNPNSYHVQARILRDLSKTANDSRRFTLQHSALELLDEGLARFNQPEDRDMLNRLKSRILNDISPEEAKEHAKNVLENENSGTGFYTLSWYYYNEEDPDQALECINKAVKADSYPAGVLNLWLRIRLEEGKQDYDRMYKLMRKLDKRQDFEHTWESQYRKSVILAINGKHQEAKDSFFRSNNMAPKHMTRVKYFWREGNSRKIFQGTIKDLTNSEGFIHDHTVTNWEDPIYFTPRQQDNEQDLKTGLDVRFELGFSLKGPQAFELKLV